MASMTVDRVQASKDYGQSLRQIHFLPVASFWAYVDEAVRRTDTGQMDTYGPNAPDGIVGQIGKKRRQFFILFGRYGHPFKYIH